MRTLDLHPAVSLGSVVDAVDPGEDAGARVVLASIERRPSLVYAVRWKKRRRKAGTTWEVWRWDGSLAHAEEPSLLLAMEHHGRVEPDCAAVEGVAQHGAKRGTLTLAESAGKACALVEMSSRSREVHRPHRNDWIGPVCGLPVSAKDSPVIACLTGKPWGTRQADWGIRVPEEMQVSHVADAVAIGLWTLGYRLTGRTP